jgi:hypothetical protein
MDPYSIPPANSGSSASNESDAAENAKADERRHERMHAFKQAIERSRPAVGEPGAPPPVVSVPAGKSSSASTGRGSVRSGILPEMILPEDAPVIAEFAQQTAALTSRQQAATSGLDPEYRQALLRMQSEGVELPASLVELLEQSGGTGKSSSEVKVSKTNLPGGAPAKQISSSDSSSEAIDAASEGRRLEIKAAHDNSGPRSKSSSEGGAKNDTTESTESSADVPVSMPNQAFAPLAASAEHIQRLPPPAPLVQQLVEFATFGRNEAGFLEFRLGLVEDALGGLRIQLASYGNRRVGLKVKGSGGKAASIGDAELAGLIDALKARNVEVIDVVRD